MNNTQSDNGTKTHDSKDIRGAKDSELKSQMERMVNSYDSYMRKMTLGRENALREMTVKLAHMSEMVRNKGIAEIYRVLKPKGKLMVLDLALPTNPVSGTIAKILLGFMLNHDLKELIPLMEASGFSEIEISQAKYRVLGLRMLSYVYGSK